MAASVTDSVARAAVSTILRASSTNFSTAAAVRRPRGRGGTSMPRRHAGRSASWRTQRSRCGQPVERDARPLVRAHPGPVGDVGDRVVAGEVLVSGEAPVEHAEEAPHLALVASIAGWIFSGK